MRRRLALLLLLVLTPACGPTPRPMPPDVAAAFHASRVIMVLDVLRDAAIAAHDAQPPVMTEDSTRKVVVWHKATIQAVQMAPQGWRASAKESIFRFSCDPAAASVSPPPPCTPLLPAVDLARLRPYISLALVVISEVR